MMSLTRLPWVAAVLAFVAAGAGTWLLDTGSEPTVQAPALTPDFAPPDQIGESRSGAGSPVPVAGLATIEQRSATRIGKLEAELRQARESIEDKNAEIARLRDTIHEMLLAALPANNEPLATAPPADPLARPPYGSSELALWEHLHAEPADPQWTNDESRRLLELINQETISGTDLIDMRCGHSVCRVETAHRDATALSALLATLGTSRGLEAVHIVVETGIPESPTGAVLYYARAGYALPSSLH